MRASRSFLPPRGETGEKDDDGGGGGGEGAGGAGCAQETEEEEDAGRQGCRRRRGQSNGNFFLARLPLRVYLFLSGIRRRAFFRGPRFRPPSFLYSTLYEDRGACIPLEGVLQSFARRAHRFRDDIFFLEQLAKARFRTNRVFRNNVKLSNIGFLHSIILDNIEIRVSTVVQSYLCSNKLTS